MKMTTNQNLLVQALFMAITAPTESKSAECLALAEWLAVGMSPSSVEKAKRWASLAAQSRRNNPHKTP